MFLNEENERAPAIAPAKRLADTLSGLLRQAVHDVLKIEGTPGYVLDMRTWHMPAGGVCHVCMAGAVMACRLDVRANQDHHDTVFKSGTTHSEARKMWAINAARVGSFYDAATYVRGGALSDLEREVSLNFEAIYCREFPNARTNGDHHAPWGFYLEVADWLEVVGL